MLTVGAFLDTLTPAEEDRLLTRVMIPNWLWEPSSGDGCLIGVAFDCRAVRQVSTTDAWANPLVNHWVYKGLGSHFNELCNRFGVVRVSAAIRNRVLANRARRLLAQPAREEVTV